MGYSTLDDFANAHAPASEKGQAAQDALDSAADWLQELAPAPDPGDTTVADVQDYEARAARAERTLAAWLLDTGSYRKTRNLGADGMTVNQSYNESPESVLSLVARTMGTWYSPPVQKRGRLRSVPLFRG